MEVCWLGHAKWELAEWEWAQWGVAFSRGIFFRLFSELTMDKAKKQARIAVIFTGRRRDDPCDLLYRAGNKAGDGGDVLQQIQMVDGKRRTVHGPPLDIINLSIYATAENSHGEGG